jgi:phosphopantothenoylcysteine decarboxylase/phosphopantothenate--cysteine ligase
MLRGRRLILGVSGGIAAYKAAEILRLLAQQGADVRVVMTAHAREFVGPLTFQALSGHPVRVDLFDPSRELDMEHITLARESDLILIAPATANVLAKLAAGLGDDLLSTLCLAARCPLVVAPSMNDWMYTHPAVQANLRTLRERGVVIIEPAEGPLACGTSGQGRLPPPPVIVEEVEAVLGRPGDMAGLTVLITAGPTREALDPVRYLSNRSSGRMGTALAAEAVRRGAAVTLVMGPGSAAPPAGARVVRVESAAQMAAAVEEEAGGADIFVAAAAVADYTPRSPSTGKLKKDGSPRSLELVPTPDILAAVGRRRPRPFVVGFCAETGDPLPEARRKRSVKGADLMVANDVSRADSGFEVGGIQVWLLDGSGEEELPLQPKEMAARAILDRVLLLRGGRS